MNLAYFYSLTLEEMSGVTRIAEKAVTALVGPGRRGARGRQRRGVHLRLQRRRRHRLVAHLLRDGGRRALLPAGGARAPGVSHAAHRAALTSAWSAFLTLTGGYEALFTYVTFASVLFGTLGGAAIFVLRARRPDVPRPYRALGYPVVPALYVLGSFALVWNTLMERPTASIAGLGLVAMGLPFYLVLVAVGAIDTAPHSSAAPLKGRPTS